jgi:hypothetical protein
MWFPDLFNGSKASWSAGASPAVFGVPPNTFWRSGFPARYPLIFGLRQTERRETRRSATETVALSLCFGIVCNSTENVGEAKM